MPPVIQGIVGYLCSLYIGDVPESLHFALPKIGRFRLNLAVTRLSGILSCPELYCPYSTEGRGQWCDDLVYIIENCPELAEVVTIENRVLDYHPLLSAAEREAIACYFSRNSLFPAEGHQLP